MRLWICILACVISMTGAVRGADVMLIANATVPDSVLDAKTVERIYLGKKSRWSDGSRIEAVMLKEGGVHDRFLRECLKRDATQFATYWKQAVFTGRGIPPKSFKTAAELISYVATTPGAVGYASSPPERVDVKVIRIP